MDFEKIMLVIAGIVFCVFIVALASNYLKFVVPESQNMAVSGNKEEITTNIEQLTIKCANDNENSAQSDICYHIYVNSNEPSNFTLGDLTIEPGMNNLIMSYSGDTRRISIRKL